MGTFWDSRQEEEEGEHSGTDSKALGVSQPCVTQGCWVRRCCFEWWHSWREAFGVAAVGLTCWYLSQLARTRCTQTGTGNVLGVIAPSLQTGDGSTW